MRRAGGLVLVLLAGLGLAGCGNSSTPVASSVPASSPASPKVAGGKVQEIRLFNGKDLTGWTVLKEGYLAGAGPVAVKDGFITLGSTEAELTGLVWAGEFPTDRYEVELEAKRVEGKDYFCGMTFPIGESRATLLVGTWDGSVVGVSNIDGRDACENDTTRRMDFEAGKWYSIRLRVADGRIQCWVSGEQMFDTATAGKQFSVWIQQDTVRPFGVTTLFTAGELRNIVLRKL